MTQSQVISAKGASAQASFSTSGEQVKIVRLSDRQKELDALPSTKTRRWVTSRKEKVVKAVRTGILTMGEACERYRLSEEEFKSWAKLLDRHGAAGLRATRIQEYRSKDQEVRETLAQSE